MGRSTAVLSGKDNISQLQRRTIAKLRPQAQGFYSHVIYGKKSRPPKWPWDPDLQQTSELSLIQIQGFLSSTALILFDGKYSHTDYAATYRPYGLESLAAWGEKSLQAPSLCGQALTPHAMSPFRDASSHVDIELSRKGSTHLNIKELLSKVTKPSKHQLFSRSLEGIFYRFCYGLV